jgi:hypothetical protein
MSLRHSPCMTCGLWWRTWPPNGNLLTSFFIQIGLNPSDINVIVMDDCPILWKIQGLAELSKWSRQAAPEWTSSTPSSGLRKQTMTFVGETESILPASLVRHGRALCWLRGKCLWLYLGTSHKDSQHDKWQVAKYDSRGRASGALLPTIECCCWQLSSSSPNASSRMAMPYSQYPPHLAQSDIECKTSTAASAQPILGLSDLDCSLALAVGWSVDWETVLRTRTSEGREEDSRRF